MVDPDGVQCSDSDSSLSEENEAAVVAFGGELDIATASELRDALAQDDVLSAAYVEVDLRDVTFLDSTTIGVLVSACKRVRSSGGRFSISCGDSVVRKTLEVTGLLEYFDVDDVPSR